MSFGEGSSHTFLPPSPNYEEKLEEFELEQTLLMHLYTTNNILIAHCMDDDEEPKRKGSIPRHIVVNRGRGRRTCSIVERLFHYESNIWGKCLS